MQIPENVPKETLLKEIILYVPDYDFHYMKANVKLKIIIFKQY